MSLFDSVLGPTTQIANSLAGKAVGYVVSNAAQKVQEATTKIASTLGIDLPFEKLGSALPSLEDMTASALKQGAAGSPFLKDLIDRYEGSLGPSVSAGQLAGYMNSQGTNAINDDYMVSLTHTPTGQILDFPVMPQISEQRSVGYEEVQAVQSPGPFQKFKGTGATVWTMNIMLISRTAVEAAENLNRLIDLRAWTKPYFGDRTGEAYPGSLGAPPPVLILNGFREKLIGPVPVVIQQLTWDWPRDVDYIAINAEGFSQYENLPFPAVMNISISLYESYSPAQMNNFSLERFRAGDLLGAYTVITNDQLVMGPGEE